MTYRQLSLDERYQIQALVKAHWSQSEIARELGRHPSTISRELSRNGGPVDTDPYRANRASKKAAARRVAKGIASRKIQGELKELIEQKLRLSWSPEQISGRLKLELGLNISHEAIYQHVIRDAHEQRGYLRYCLRFGGYKHHRCKKSKHAERTRQRKNWIDARPAEANERRELGHWERDCIVGKRGGAAILTIVDRKSRYTRIRRVQRLDTKHVGRATTKVLRPYRDITKTLTNDNGVEFQRDVEIKNELDIPIYFCDPASPWQRGTVENTNGLIRQYLRKGTGFDDLPEWIEAAVEETLNFRPRKTLAYRTPHEVFYNQSITLTQNQAMQFGLEFSQAF
jgi:transposase, IS30 family